MKTKIYLLGLAVALCWLSMPVSVYAQRNHYLHEDAYYITDAVPEENGRIVFSREIKIPGKNKEEVYNQILGWMTERLAKNGNDRSRIVYTDFEKGKIAGSAAEWLVFHSLSMSLDRAWMTYQLSAICDAGKCTLRMEKINYVYEEKLHYRAEDMIADKIALNKDKNKIYRGYAKWRKKTVDFADELFSDAQNVMNSILLHDTQKQSAVQEDRKETEPVEKKAEVDFVQTSFNPDQGTLVVCVGSEPFNMTTMTVDCGGCIETKDGKQIMLLRFGPQQSLDLLKDVSSFVVKYYAKGTTTPAKEWNCRPDKTGIDLKKQEFAAEILVID